MDDFVTNASSKSNKRLISAHFGSFRLIFYVWPPSSPAERSIKRPRARMGVCDAPERENLAREPELLRGRLQHRKKKGRISSRASRDVRSTPHGPVPPFDEPSLARFESTRNVHRQLSILPPALRTPAQRLSSH
jgi:hypothetical protein